MLWLLQCFLLALVDGRRGYCACCALILHGIGDREACMWAASAAWDSEVAAYWTLDGHLLYGWMAWLHERILRLPGLVFVELDLLLLLCIAWSIWWWQQLFDVNKMRTWPLVGVR